MVRWALDEEQVPYDIAKLKSVAEQTAPLVEVEDAVSLIHI